MRSELTHELTGKLFMECKKTDLDCIVFADEGCYETMLCEGSPLGVKHPGIQSQIASLEEFARAAVSSRHDKSLPAKEQDHV